MTSPPTLPQNAPPELAVQRARLLVGCYRREDFADAEIASRSFISVLARYPEDVVIKVTEPATGIPSKLKWPPSIAEVVDACNEAMAPILREFDRKMVAHRQARLLAAPLPGPKMTVAEMEAKLGRPLSGWVRRVDGRPRFTGFREAEEEVERRRRESAGLPEPPELFKNSYCCLCCGHEWTDLWSSTCDDDCPQCGARHISPHKSEDAA